MLKHISTAVQIKKLEMEQVRSCQWKKNENSKCHTETSHKVNGHIHAIQLNMINNISSENGGVIENLLKCTNFLESLELHQKYHASTSITNASQYALAIWPRPVVQQLCCIL